MFINDLFICFNVYKSKIEYNLFDFVHETWTNISKLKIVINLKTEQDQQILKILMFSVVKKH